MNTDETVTRDDKEKSSREMADSDSCCCYVIDPCACGCYTDPCGCHVDSCCCC